MAEHITSISQILRPMIWTRAYPLAAPTALSCVPRCLANTLLMALMRTQQDVVRVLGLDASKQADSTQFTEVLSKKKKLSEKSCNQGRRHQHRQCMNVASEWWHGRGQENWNRMHGLDQRALNTNYPDACGYAKKFMYIDGTLRLMPGMSPRQ